MKNIFIPVALALFLLCSEEPLSPNNQPLRGAAIKGKLVTTDGAPAKGVVMRLFEKKSTPALGKVKMQDKITQSEINDSVETDENGYYYLPLPDSGVYNIIGSSNDKSVFISDVHVSDTQPVEMETHTVQSPGMIRGVTFMPGLDSVNQIRVTMYIPGTGFIIKPIPGGQFTFPIVPPGSYKLIFDPTNTNYYVKLMDITIEAGSTLNLDTIVLYGASYDGIPIVDAGGNKTVSINDSIQISFSAIDTLGQIVKYWIDSEGDGIFEDSCTTSGILAFKASATPETKLVIVKVIDNDGNIDIDTATINVVQDIPSVDAGPDIQLMPNKSQFTLHGSGIDSIGQIVKWEWNVNNTGFIETSTGDTVFPFIWEKGTSIECILRVTDDDGNAANDTTIVTLKNGIMLDDMESGDSINENGWTRYVTDDSYVGGNSTFTNFERDSIGNYKVKPTQDAGLDSSSGFKIEFSMGDKETNWGGHSIRAGIMLTQGNTVDMSVNKKLSFWMKSSVERSFTIQIRTLNDTCVDAAYYQYIDASTEWNEFTIDVTGDDFSLPTWVLEQYPFEANKVVEISWYAEGDQDFTGWLSIDNIYLHE